MSVSAKDVQKLRNETGAGFMDCKRALDEAEGDIDRAKDLIKSWGMAGVAKRSGRSADEGGVFNYLHRPDQDLPARVGVMVEVNCETDFVAKTNEFQELGRGLAVHIAGSNPRWVRRDDIPDDVVERERKVIEASDAVKGKPEKVVQQIVEGKVDSLFKENGGELSVLLDQIWSNTPDGKGDKSVSEVIADLAASTKENIVVRRFARFEVGRD